MSYSEKSRSTRKKFETDEYKKYANSVAYLGPPPNNRKEYFDIEALALQWIFKKIRMRLTDSFYVDIKEGRNAERKLPNGVICLDSFAINWQQTFNIAINGIWFHGDAMMATAGDKRVILMELNNFDIYIINDKINAEDFNVNDFDIFEPFDINFKAPLPQLESVILYDEYKMTSIYCLHVTWSNTNSRVTNNNEKKIEINFATYSIIVMQKHKIRAIIYPL